MTETGLFTPSIKLAALASIFLGLVATSAGRAGAADLTSVPAKTPALPMRLKVMTLGDSMTQGYQGAKIGGYRGPLYRGLKAESYKTKMTGSFFCGTTKLLPAKDQDCDGEGGDTIADLDARVQTGIVKTENPDVVLLLIGFNSIYYTDNTIAEDLTELSGVVDDIYAQKPNVHLIVSSLIVSTQCCNQSLIPEYNAGIPAIVSAKAAQGFPVSFVDMYPVVPAQDLADGVHPDDAGYELMAGAWLQAINDVAGTKAKPVATGR